ncbi:radical SAM protein [Caldisericum sp. AR60]|uniref:radical SAM protein n=3 Tax=unclassified Caldisericum TaxID=2641600 RepID=UPI0039FD8FD8
MKNIKEIAFGPVPSRRLGRSLGVNNIPPKICTYSCVYCQLGRNLKMSKIRQAFYDPEDVFNAVKIKVEDVLSRKEKIDYITFVPDGEPTLDINLGKELSLIKTLGIKVAIISNSSLIDNPDVQNELMGFDLVSLKVDAVSNDIFKKINRPFKGIELDNILQGIRDFSSSFKGILITETMIIDNIDYGDEFEKIGEFLASLNNLEKAYISIPTRPPQEDWGRPPKEETVNEAFQIFETKLPKKVEYLIGYEGNAFSYSGNLEEDVLSITAVHPMREDALMEIVEKDKGSFEVIEKLIRNGLIKKIQYQGQNYYLRKFF